MARMSQNSGDFPRETGDGDVPLPHPSSGVFAALAGMHRNASVPLPSKDDAVNIKQKSSFPQYVEPYDSTNESRYENDVPQLPSKRRPSPHTDSGKGTGDDTDTSTAPVPPPLKPRAPKMKPSRRKETDTSPDWQQILREDTEHGTIMYNPIYKPKSFGYWQSCRIPGSTECLWKPLSDRPDRPSQGSWLSPSKSFIVQRPGGCCTISVKNIAPNVGDIQVVSMFETFGDLEILKIERCPHNYSAPGIRVAFIKYDGPDHARRAVSTMNGEVVQGCTLIVAFHPTKRDKADFNLLQNQYWKDVHDGRMEGLAVEVEGNNKHRQYICPTFAKLSDVKTNRISFALVKQLGYSFAERDEYELQEGHDSTPIAIYGYLKLRLRVYGQEWVDLTFKITPHLPNGVELNKKTQAILGLILPEAVDKERTRVIATTLKKFKLFRKCIASETGTK